MTKSLVEQYVADPQHMREYQQERAIYEVTELLETEMDVQGVSRSQLAKKLGRSKSWVTQLLDGDKNKTIRTLADVFAVLGCEYRSFTQPIQIGRKFAGQRSSQSTDHVESGEGPPVLTFYGDFHTEFTAESSDPPPKRAVN